MRKRSTAAATIETEEAAVSVSEPSAYFNAVWTGSKVALLWRDERGEVRKREVPAEHCCHLRLDDWTPELETQLRRHPGVRGFKVEGAWVRLTFRDRDACRDLCQRGGYFELSGIPTFEADLHPTRRWLAEHPEVQIQRPLRGYLDLESDSRVPFERLEEARILIAGFLNAETGVFWQGVLEEDTDAAECELLAQLWEQLGGVDQVAMWAGSAHAFQKGRRPGVGIFDVDLLLARTARYSAQLRIEPRRWLWISHLEAYAKMNMSAAGSGEEKQSLALNAVARSLGLAGKEDFDASKMWEAWLGNGEDLDRACSYNARDVRVMLEIEHKKPYLDLITSVCIACGVFPDHRGMNGTAYVESFILRLSNARGFHWKSHWGYRASEPFEGAFVLEPKQLGVQRHVHVCDFASLYPSIIQTWNLSPETHAPEHKLVKELARPAYLAHLPPVVQPIPPGHCRAPNTGETFRVDVIGMLPIAVTELRRLRQFHTDEAKKYPPGTPEHLFHKNLADGFKICVNTFYGVAGSPFSRFFERAVAESTSTTGAWLIKHVMREAEARGWRIQAGDTDSAFIVGCTQQEFQDFVSWLNDARLPQLVTEQGCERNELKLEAEKGFDVLVTVAKKRYCGRFSYFKGKAAVAESKPEVKGLEYKRGDTVRLARDLQKETLDRLICLDQFPVPAVLPYRAADFQALGERWRDRVTKGDIEPADYIVSKSLGQPLSTYRAVQKKDGSDGAFPAHVEVAKRMKASGMNVNEGTRIAYVVVDGSASPQKTVGLWEFEPGMEDRHYLWETQVWPPTLRVLEACFPEHDWKPLSRSRPYRGKSPKYGGAGDGQRGLPGVADDLPVPK